MCVCVCVCVWGFHHTGYMSQRVAYYERKYQSLSYPISYMSYIIDGMAQQHCLLPHLGFDCPFRLTFIFLKNYFSVIITFRQRPYIYWVVAPTPSRSPCAWSTLQCLQVCKSSISYNICSTNQVNTEHSEIFELALPTLPSLVCFWILKNASKRMEVSRPTYIYKSTAVQKMLMSISLPWWNYLSRKGSFGIK